MSSIDKHFQQATLSANTSSSKFIDPGQDLRRIAVKTLQEKTAESPVSQDGQLPREIRDVIQELQVHQIELELQNEELRRSQTELGILKDQYFDLYDLAPVGYMTVSERGLILEANLTVASLLGVVRRELIKKPVSRFILHDDQDIYYLFCNQFMEVPEPPPGTPQTRSEQADRQQGCDLRMLNGDGRAFFWAHLQATTVQDTEGMPVYRIMLSDITDRKEAEALRVKLEAKSRRIQTAEGLERMAGSIAHLFNNQLFIVIGNLELALDDGASLSSRDKLIEALQAAHRSEEISQLMLTYLGQSNVKLDHVDISEICRQELPGIKAILPRGVTIRTSLVSPGPVVNANENQIKQILANLITNGSDAIMARSGRGEIKIVIKTLSASDISGSDIFSADLIPFAETFACLEVTDTGCGMSKEEVVKIFDPFYSTKNIGRGLGLAMAKGLLKSWGGMIGVQTAVGLGSRFRVFIPLVANAVSRPTEISEGKEDFETRGTILFVDDDDIVRNLAESMIEHIGFSVISAAGGDEAVVLFKKHRDSIDCLLTDLSMPGLDGWETLAALRNIQPHLPAILSSGYDESQAMSGDHVELPQAFLHKPYTMSYLKEVLHRVLGDTKKDIK